MNEAKPSDNAATLQEVKNYAKKLADARSKRIQAAALTPRSKLPFKGLVIRELLLHRAVALTSAAVDLFGKDQVVPAVILTRSIIETLAVLVDFHEKLARFLNDEEKDCIALDRFLMCSLMGSRNNPDTNMPKSVNILSLIDRVEKIAPGFRSVYDSLCEYAHPNWAGTFGSFGEIVAESNEIELGTGVWTAACSAGLLALSGSLIAFELYHEKSGNLVQTLNDYFDKNCM